MPQLAESPLPVSDRPRRFRLPACAAQRTCPRCQSNQTHGNGSFRWKNGTRRPRFLCRACGVSYNPNTGSALHYLKKREAWARQAGGLGRALSVRRMASDLGVSPATAFAWRHRVMRRLVQRPQPVLQGPTAVGEMHVPYSEKGSRSTNGPGAWGSKRDGRPFRRLRDGKASCVLLAAADKVQTALVVGQGRPSVNELTAGLARILGSGASVQPCGWAPYAQACQSLGIKLADGGPVAQVYSLARRIFAWLTGFHGVATRYLSHYLTWHRYARRGPADPAELGRRMLAEAAIPGLLANSSLEQKLKLERNGH